MTDHGALPDFSVAGLHVLITGGTGGIGGAFARAFVAKGATATVTFIDPAMGNLELGNMVLPVFARAPNWDPREQQCMPPHPGTYYARVTVDPNGCQRIALRMTLQ